MAAIVIGPKDRRKQTRKVLMVMIRSKGELDKIRGRWVIEMAQIANQPSTPSYGRKQGKALKNFPWICFDQDSFIIFSSVSLMMRKFFWQEFLLLLYLHSLQTKEILSGLLFLWCFSPSNLFQSTNTWVDRDDEAMMADSYGIFLPIYWIFSTNCSQASPSASSAPLTSSGVFKVFWWRIRISSAENNKISELVRKTNEVANCL